MLNLKHALEVSKNSVRFICLHLSKLHMFTIMYYGMSEGIFIRISRELKGDLEKLRINYSETIRNLLEDLVRKEKMRRLLEDSDKIRNSLLKQGYFESSAELIREDREKRRHDSRYTCINLAV